LTRDQITMGSPEPVRDLTCVKDTVQGFISVGLCDKVLGQVVNLGVGYGDSVGAVVKTILRILGKENMPIEKDSFRVRPDKSEVMCLVSNNKIAREVCGWEPKYELETGLAETIEWVKRNLDRYRPDTYVI